MLFLLMDQLASGPLAITSFLRVSLTSHRENHVGYRVAILQQSPIRPVLMDQHAVQTDWAVSNFVIR